MKMVDICGLGSPTNFDLFLDDEGLLKDNRD
jgi:hypothetical protein